MGIFFFFGSHKQAFFKKIPVCRRDFLYIYIYIYNYGSAQTYTKLKTLQSPDTEMF